MLLTVIFVFVICYTCYYMTKNKVEDTKTLVANDENKLQFAISSRLQYAKTLEIDVISHKGEIEDFEEVAAFLYNEDPVIRSIQLAPDGVVTYVYPIEGNENVSIDLFSDPDRRPVAQQAMDTGQIVLSGPITLVQGGMGLVANNPIYIDDGAGNSRFWGFSTVVFNSPQIFEIANLDFVNSDEYYYRLWKYPSGSGGDVKLVVLENTSDPLSNAIVEEITISNLTFYLDIAPKNKWVYRPLLYLFLAVSAVIIFLSMLAYASYLTIQEQREELLRQNVTDVLTGIKNGRFYMNSLREFARQKKPCTIYYLDLDCFKEINDNYGHDEGDRILIEVAKRIACCVRDTDIVARIGGDEFVVVLTTEETAGYCIDLQKRIKQSVGEEYDLKGDVVRPRISIGFASYPSESDDIEKVMRLADQRMYAEKRASKEPKES